MGLLRIGLIFMYIRLLQILALSIEMSMLLGFTSIFAMGGLPENPFFVLWLLVAVAVVATLTAVGLPRQITSRLATHGALIAGSVLFALPFLWLVGTSFKYPEETFESPPRWIPEFPEEIRRSPYIAAPKIEAACPEEFGALIWESAQRLLPPTGLARLDQTSARLALTGVIWDIASSSNAEPTRTDVIAATNAENVALAWERIFRAVEVGRITVFDKQRVAHSIDHQYIRWHVAGADLKEAGEATRLQYDFDETDGAAVQLTLDLALPLPSDELFQVSVGMRQDRSWHRYEAELLIEDRRYVSADPFYLGDDGYIEIGFKLGGEDERDLGVFDLEDNGRVSESVVNSGNARLVLTILPSSHAEAAWGKYTQSYRDAWYADRQWPRYLLNSALIVGLSILGQILSCTMVAYAFARIRWPGRGYLFGLLLATMMLPGQVTMIPVFMIFKSMGWYNTLLPLWVPAFLASPFFVFLLRQFMKSIPREIEEAALIDGCSWYGIYWRIILPLMKPGIAAVAIFTFMGAWNEFMGPLIYLSDSRLYPLAMGLYNFRSEHGGEFGMLMAASTIMIIPAILLFFICQRYFIEGVTLTGVKG